MLFSVCDAESGVTTGLGVLGFVETFAGQLNGSTTVFDVLRYTARCSRCINKQNTQLSLYTINLT